MKVPERRLKLCFVGWADHVHLERWAGHFAKLGHEVTVISTSGPGRYPPGVRQYSLGAGRGPRSTRLRLRWLLWRIRPQLVHVHWAHFAADVRAVWRGPFVVTAWGSDIYRRENFSAEVWDASCRAMAAADLLTCDSEDLADALRQALPAPPRALEVVQWGVDTALFTPDGASQRDALGLQGREVIFSARNFTPIYNQETVVAAFARVHAQRPQAFLLMKRYGGDADYLARIEAQIDTAGLRQHVRILDAVPYEEMPALYRSADVMISIPLSDAAPMSLLEAMASEVAPLVCDLPSLREWVEPGVTGLLAEARDTDAVTAALLQLLADADQRRAIGRRGRALVEARASQAVHMGRMVGRYAALVDGQPLEAEVAGQAFR